jgi:hypothetical protein
MKSLKRITFIIAITALLLLTACGGKKDTVSIDIAPETASVEAGATITLTVTTKNTEIIWPADVDVVGNHSYSGNTATWTLPVTSGTYEFTVTAAADSTKKATAKITVTMPKETAVVNIEKDTTMTVPNKQVSLRAHILPTDTSVASYNWKFSDGQNATGREVSVSFPKAGEIGVVLEVMTVNGTKLAGGDFLFVVDEQTSGLIELDKPFGDLDGDEKTTLLDALLLAQSLHGNYTLPVEDTNSADLDLDNVVTASDLTLELKAVVQETQVPSAVLKDYDYIYPGSVVAVVSPALLNPTDIVQVKVGDVVVSEPFRATPGYVSFVVPTELATNLKTTTIDLLVDDTTKDSFQISVRQLEALPSDAAKDVLLFMDEFRTALKEQKIAVQNSNTELLTENRDQLLAYSDASLTMLTQAMDEMNALFGTEDGLLLAKLLQEALYANGLAELRVQNSSNMPTGNARIQSIVSDINCLSLAGICEAKYLMSESHAYAQNMIKGLETAIANAARNKNGAWLLPVIGTAWGAAVVADGAFDIGDMLTGSIKMSLKMTASSDPDPIIKTGVVTSGISMCGAGGSTIVGVVQSVITKKVVKFMPMVKILVYDSKGKTIPGIGQYILDMLDAATARAGFTLNSWADTYVGKFCKYIASKLDSYLPGSYYSIVSADKVIASSFGNIPISFNPDDTATFMCSKAPADNAGKSFKLPGVLDLPVCGALSSQVTFSCEGKREVVVRIGDNGAAKDDLFEVMIDGKTVTTNGVPGGYKDVTLELEVGSHSGLLIGLAAPDGIGTYEFKIIQNGSSIYSSSGIHLDQGVTIPFSFAVRRE